MVYFVINELGEPLQQSGLYPVVRVVMYEIPQNNHHFFAMFELYNADTCTFFTAVGELGFAPHEMFEVFRLLTGEMSYVEYVPSTEELHLLKKSAHEV